MDFDSMRSEVVEKERAPFLEVLKGKNAEPFEFRVSSENKDIYWVEAIPTFIETFNKKNAIQVISRDITDRKSTHERMKNQLNSLRYFLTAHLTAFS